MLVGVILFAPAFKDRMTFSAYVQPWGACYSFKLLIAMAEVCCRVTTVTPQGYACNKINEFIISIFVAGCQVPIFSYFLACLLFSPIFS